MSRRTPRRAKAVRRRSVQLELFPLETRFFPNDMIALGQGMLLGSATALLAKALIQDSPAQNGRIVVVSSVYEGASKDPIEGHGWQLQESCGAPTHHGIE